jgi:hypothetical protein
MLTGSRPRKLVTTHVLRVWEAPRSSFPLTDGRLDCKLKRRSSPIPRYNHFVTVSVVAQHYAFYSTGKQRQGSTS